MRLAAHLALVVAGLAAVAWALTWAADPVIMCRDVVMGPGSVCTNADGTGAQTFEARLATWNAARPVVVALGALVAAFGIVLSVQAVRRQGSRLIGP